MEELTSSYTSLTAAPQGSSSGSIPPPGTIHWSGCRLLLTSITFQEQRPASSLCRCILGDQKHANGMPKFKVPRHYRCLLAKCGASHPTGHVWKISRDVMPANHYVWIRQREHGQDWASWTSHSCDHLIYTGKWWHVKLNPKGWTDSTYLFLVGYFVFAAVYIKLRHQKLKGQ